MSSGNKSFRRFFAGGLLSFSLCTTFGTAPEALNASPAPVFKSDVERDRADLSLETAFWRSEFQWTDAKAIPDQGTNSSPSPQGTHQANDVFSGIAAAEDFFENESLLSSDAAAPERVAHSQSQVMTDWEKAICNADGVQVKTMTTQGPSAVTAVVAVVGAVVVFGAYFKSSGK